MERLVGSTRIPVLFKSGGSDWGQAIRVVFVRISPTRWRDEAVFIDSTLRSVSQHLLSATVSWTAWAADNSGTRAQRRATGRATDGAWSGMDRS